MKQLKIKYYQEKCIGVGSCTKLAPAYFQMDGNKAALLKAKKEDSYYVLEIDCTDEQYAAIIAAGTNCPVNVIEIIDQKTGKTLVEKDVSLAEACEEIEAKYDDDIDFILDEKGYFLIRVDSIKKLIEVGFCSGKNKVTHKIIGKKPIEIYQTILKKGIITRPDHAAYLGRELQKAYIALQQNLSYVQDDELKFN